jgi:gamma-glutamylcyclotransferase (GGCT)/AIG2-like uncharacterized protein YtfP
MDNTRDLPGYKYYLDPATGGRPAIYVAYVDLAPDAASSVEGVVFAVDERALDALDRRERNYERIDVTPRINPAPERRVWTYRGTADARERFELGLATGTVVVDRAYYESVRVGEPPPVPIRSLERIDLKLAKAPRRA